MVNIAILGTFPVPVTQALRHILALCTGLPRAARLACTPPFQPVGEGNVCSYGTPPGNAVLRKSEKGTELLRRGKFRQADRYVL